MSAGKAAPSIMQSMVVRLCADLKGDQLMQRRALSWFASCDEVRSRSPNRILDDVGEHAGEDEGNGEAEECDVRLVRRWMNKQREEEQYADWEE